MSVILFGKCGCCHTVLAGGGLQAQTVFAGLPFNFFRPFYNGHWERPGFPDSLEVVGDTNAGTTLGGWQPTQYLQQRVTFGPYRGITFITTTTYDPHTGGTSATYSPDLNAHFPDPSYESCWVNLGYGPVPNTSVGILGNYYNVSVSSGGTSSTKIQQTNPPSAGPQITTEIDLLIPRTYVATAAECEAMLASIPLLNPGFTVEQTNNSGVISLGYGSDPVPPGVLRTTGIQVFYNAAGALDFVAVGGTTGFAAKGTGWDGITVPPGTVFANAVLAAKSAVRHSSRFLSKHVAFFNAGVFTPEIQPVNIAPGETIFMPEDVGGYGQAAWSTGAAAGLPPSRITADTTQTTDTTQTADTQ